MYSTVTEIHNAIDIGTQLVNSNRKRTFQPPELDVLFNRNLLRFIDTRSTSKTNLKQEGFDDSTKRIIDLEELKRNTGYLTPMIYDENTCYIVLPNNFKLPYGGVSKVYYDCVEKDIATKSVSVSIANLVFNNDNTGVSNIFYKNFKLTATDNNNNQVVLFDINNYINLEPLYSPDTKFMIINMIMNIVNPNLTFYWEKYNDTFLPNTFIVVDFTNTYKSVQIDYDTNINITAQFVLNTNLAYDVKHNIVSSTELVSSDKYNNLIDNVYYNKNRQGKPLIKIENGRLYIRHDNFYPALFKLEYIATPIFINSFTGQMTNLRNNIQEVIDMTIEDIFAILNGTYQGIINRNAKIE
jgi:hypothetical protein